jgi:hypothetical protein
MLRAFLSDPPGLEVAPELLQAEPHPPFHRAERQPQEICYLYVRASRVAKLLDGRR